MSWTSTVSSLAIATALVSIGLVPAAAAGGPVDDAWQTYEETREDVYDEVDEVEAIADDEVCETLKGGGYTAWECVQYFYCGGSHCIERKIWSP